MHELTRKYTVPISHGTIALEEHGEGSSVVFMIHGNSTSGEAFCHQLQGPLADSHRLIAVDLPGHGASPDAVDPARTYTRPGFADAMVELLAQLGLKDPVLLGWSLGGHIALEMAVRMPALRGIMLCGTPPVGKHMAEGFRAGPGMQYASQERLSAQEIEAFGRRIMGESFTPPLRAAIERTHGLARKTMFEAARAGAGVDQRWVVENLEIPLAVVNGADDALVNLDYIDGLHYARLWSARCHRLAGAGHAVFREQPRAFDALLARFLDDVAPQAPSR